MLRLTENGNYLLRIRRKGLFCLITLCCLHMTAQAQTLHWKFKHALTGQVIDLGEKGSVQEALIRENMMPDPFYGENEKEFGWIEKYDWEFSSTLMLSAQQLENEFIELDFPSIDTYAKIYVNDQLAAETANAFHPHRIEIKPYVQVGLNQIKIVFTSPINYHRAAYQARKSQLPAPNDVGEIAVASYSRKPQYQFGWDWALRMNTIGFWQPAQLRCFSNNRLVQVKYETLDLQPNQANMQVSVYLDKKSLEAYRIESDLFGTLDKNVRNGVMFQHQVQLKSPQLWWPRGQGDQHLYTDTIRLYDATGRLLDTKAARFGVRTSESIREKDHWGTSFYFKINGRPIFCKGANYIPQEVFPAKVSAEHTRKLVADMALSNFNTVRVWGGGYYPEEAFFEACDELGILVWQDLMFACAMYPGDETFLKLVQTELNEVIPRITAHPSVFYLNGNNEVDVAWKNWGFQIRYLIGPRTQRQIERDYERVFKKLAPEVIAEHTNLPYIHTSPLSNWGKDEYFNHGTMHYWGVWHGKDPIEDFGLKTGRFNAEYGFQSFPEYSTLRSFSTENDWSLNSSVMKHHQKSYVGNGMISKQSDLLFGTPANFREFVYFSQLTQAKAVGIAVAGHRADAPRCMGTLYWQFNDCWPAPTWSGIDYFDNWKALQYQMKQDYADVTIVEKAERDGKKRYFLLSDHPDPVSITLQFTAFDLNGNQLFTGEEKINSDGNTLHEVCQMVMTDRWKDENFVIKMDWSYGGEKHTRTFFHERKSYSKALNTQFTLRFEADANNPLKGFIILKTDKFLASCWIYSENGGVRFSENFEHYLPGEYRIEVSSDKPMTTADFELMWR